MTAMSNSILIDRTRMLGLPSLVLIAICNYFTKINFIKIAKMEKRQATFCIPAALPSLSRK